MRVSTSLVPADEPVPRRLARAALLLFVFLLPFMQPALRVFGLEAVAADAAYLLLAALWATALATGAARLRWHSAFWLLGFYFAAMALAAAASEAPRVSAVKLASQAYLLSLPVIVFSLVGAERELRALFAAWLAATATVAMAAILSVAAFFIDPGSPLFAWAINDFGTLPPGHYPRLRLTFLYAAMLCNYLTVSLMILLVARHLGWIGRRPFLVLLVGILFSAAFSLTPGLGGIFLAGGTWAWLILKERRGLGRLALAGGIGAAALFVLAMAVTPILHPTAPFLIQVPGTEVTLAPAVRLMAWIEAARNFADDPLLGRGLGMPAVDVHILIPRGELSGVTDAHNTFLNIAVQCGIVGLAAVLAILAWVAGKMRPFRPVTPPANLLRIALAFAFLNAFAYQGLGGSFEDSRHLWVLFGLILAAHRPGAAHEERAAPAGTAHPRW